MDGIRTFPDTDMLTYQRFYVDYLRELDKQIEQVSSLLVPYLERLGYPASTSTKAPLLFVTVPASFVSVLESRLDVALIEYGGGDFEELLASATPTIRPERVWSTYTDGSGVNVAIVDCGNTDFSHPALASASGPSRYPLASITEHATQVAGVIASTDSTRKGAAPGVQLMSATLFSDGLCPPGKLETQPWIDSVDWAIDNYAHLVSSSVGRDTDTLMGVMDRYADHLAFNLGRLVVQAAANACLVQDGGDCDVWSPGLGFNVLTVGGTEDGDDKHWSGDFRYPPSSYQEGVGSEKPEVSAVARLETTSISPPWEIVEGTSLAAPAVAGEAALLLADSGWMTPRPELTKAIVMASALHNSYGTRMNDDQEGLGTINANEAFRTLKNGWYDSGTLYISSVGQHFHRSVYAEQDELVRIVLNYLSHPNWQYTYDYMASDLDMYVYSPSGSPVASSASRSSVYEAVEFVAGETGYYDVDIVVFRSIFDWFEYYGLAWSRTPTYVFTGSVLRGQDSTQHAFTVPYQGEEVYVRLDMPSYADLDLSVWDYYGYRTGGKTSTDPIEREEIPNSEYSGRTSRPEWVWVSPSEEPFEFWYVGCYAYWMPTYIWSASYTIRVSTVGSLW